MKSARVDQTLCLAALVVRSCRGAWITAFRRNSLRLSSWISGSDLSRRRKGQRGDSAGNRFSMTRWMRCVRAASRRSLCHSRPSLTGSRYYCTAHKKLSKQQYEIVPHGFFGTRVAAGFLTAAALPDVAAGVALAAGFVAGAVAAAPGSVRPGKFRGYSRSTWTCPF